MQPQNGQLVCSRCGAWVDPGTAPAAMGAEHERAKEPRPIRPPRPHPQGYAGTLAA